jgi:hypothetical protein
MHYYRSQAWDLAKDCGLREIHRQATEISYRAQGFLIAIKSDVTDTCLGQSARHSFK